MPRVMLGRRLVLLFTLLREKQICNSEKKIRTVPCCCFIYLGLKEQIKSWERTTQVSRDSLGLSVTEFQFHWLKRIVIAFDNVDDIRYDLESLQFYQEAATLAYKEDGKLYSHFLCTYT